ncbi:MAG: hypothetical protein RLN60_00165 [Phycisphaerales bacterium]
MNMSPRPARHPFVVGIMIGLVLNLCMLDLLRTPAYAQQAQPVGPIVQPVDPRPIDPALEQAKDVYEQLFNSPFTADGSYYFLDSLPDTPGLFDAYNPKNDINCLLDVVAVDPIDWTLPDLVADGLTASEIQAVITSAPVCRLIFGRLTSDIGEAEVIGVSWEYTGDTGDMTMTDPWFMVLGDFQQFARIPECPNAPVEIMSPDFDGTGLECLGNAPAVGPIDPAQLTKSDTLDLTESDGTAATDAEVILCIAAALVAYNFCMQIMRAGLAACLRSVAVRAAACVVSCGFSCFFWVSCAICLARCAVIAAVGAAVCLAAADAAGATCLAVLAAALVVCGPVIGDLIGDIRQPVQNVR